LLQRHLGLPTPLYLHTPLVLGAHGEKLSKQNGAAALDTSTPETVLLALQQAASALGLGSGSAWGSSPGSPGTLADALAAWTAEWRQRFASELAVRVV
jgi:glutamyl-Q tRNA(Asp) synthetase